MPIASEEVEKVALPPTSVAVASVVLPSMNATVPLGVPEPGTTALTAAAKVTVCPNTDGFTDDVTVVELESLLTVCVIPADVLLAKLVSPE